MRTLSLAAVAAVLIGAASPSSAVPVYVHGYEPGLSAHIEYDRPFNGGVRAGGYDTSVGDNRFITWCIDLFSPLSRHVRHYSHTEGHSPELNSHRENLLDRLFTSVYHTIDTAREGAAFQAAIWEIVHDTGLNVYSGNMYLDHTGSIYTDPTIRNYAQSYLDGLDHAGTGGYNLHFLHHSHKQDLVHASPVPVPAGMALMLTGLGGLALYRRRKSKA